MKLFRTQRQRRIYIWLLILLFFMAGGVFGYMIIEKYTLTQALYMVIITISTVGFGEVKPLSEKGIIFTSVFIVFNFLIVGIVFRNILSYIFEGEFLENLKARKMEKIMKNIKNHTIVCGFGRNGQHAVEELLMHNQTVVVIEKNEELYEKGKEKFPKVIFIKGNATHEDILLKANITTAKALISTLPLDADNVFIVLTARDLNPNAIIISRASDDHSDVKLKRAGADFVILPDIVGGTRMAKLVVEPDVIEFLEYLMLKSHEDVNLVEIPSSELPPKYLNNSISELDIRKQTGANIIGMKLDNGKYIFNPDPQTQITPQSKLFVLGTPNQIRKFKEIIKEK